MNDPLAVRRTEGRADVRVLESGSVGPSIFMRGTFESCRWLGGPCPFSRPE